MAHVRRIPLRTSRRQRAAREHLAAPNRSTTWTLSPARPPTTWVHAPQPRITHQPSPMLPRARHSTCSGQMPGNRKSQSSGPCHGKSDRPLGLAGSRRSSMVEIKQDRVRHHSESVLVVQVAAASVPAVQSAEPDLELRFDDIHNVVYRVHAEVVGVEPASCAERGEEDMWPEHNGGSSFRLLRLCPGALMLPDCLLGSHEGSEHEMVLRALSILYGGDKYARDEHCVLTALIICARVGSLHLERIQAAVDKLFCDAVRPLRRFQHCLEATCKVIPTAEGHPINSPPPVKHARQRSPAPAKAPDAVVQEALFHHRHVQQEARHTVSAVDNAIAALERLDAALNLWRCKFA